MGWNPSSIRNSTRDCTDVAVMFVKVLELFYRIADYKKMTVYPIASTSTKNKEVQYKHK